MPEVTVLTAVRNGAKYLPDTIASIQAQTFTDWEYIIVDDGSIDDTPRIVEHLSRTDPRIKLIRRDHPGGPFIAATEGAQYATGAYIVRTDGDDVSLPWRIERQLRYLKENASLRACAAYGDVLTDSGIIPGYIYDPPLSSGTIKWWLCLRNRIVHSTACVERNAFRIVYCEKPSDKIYSRFGESGDKESPLPDMEDYRMWCDLARRGWLGVVPEILVHFRRHSNRVSVKKASEQHQLFLSVLNEHLESLTGYSWSHSDLEKIYKAGHGEAATIRDSLAIIDYWNQLWHKDTALTADERDELKRISKRQKWLVVRRNVRYRIFTSLRARYKSFTSLIRNSN